MIGHHDIYDADRAGDLMAGYLKPGESRLPEGLDLLRRVDNSLTSRFEPEILFGSFATLDLGANHSSLLNGESQTEDVEDVVLATQAKLIDAAFADWTRSRSDDEDDDGDLPLSLEDVIENLGSSD